MHQIDESFKKAKVVAAQRKRRIRLRRWSLVVGVLALAGIGSGIYFGLGGLHLRLGTGQPPAKQETAATGDQPSDAAVFVPAIVDLAGDPMKISLGGVTGADQAKHTLPRPDGVPQTRAADQIVLLSDTMVTASQRFMTTLPSSPQDFAFYQAQRITTPTVKPVAAVTPVAAAPVATEAAAAPAPGSDLAAVAASGALPSAPAPVVEDTTSVAVVRRQEARFVPDQDFFSKVLVARSLADIILENHLAPDDAAAFDAAMKSMLGKQQLDVGDVVAIRGAREDAAQTALGVVQVSIYNSTGYIGTLSRGDDGAIGMGADPWVFQNLFNYSDQKDVAQAGQQYRLLDAIYSTGARNGVPTEVLGEAIMLLSRSFDLNAFASADDKFYLAYARSGDIKDAGRVLFAGVKGTGRDIECYVYKGPADSDYSCSKGSMVAASSSSSGNMVTPVNGALTAKFGPQVDPVSKQVKQHSGIDWAAPLGTAVVAAFPGTVTFAGPAAGGGNLVRISHPDGRETWYSPLQGFAPGLAVGKPVRAGDPIGTVGTTSTETGPHLHFELHTGGVAVDPLQTASVSLDDNSAVETLTDRIINVESGGSATARNPLSTAVGAGQFITTTWLRMIKTYRPDLAASMSDNQILDLRTDPTLSREMVQNLAREGEAYLKAHGQSVTAGRLYLCHFLGMQAAVVVLAAAADTPLDTLVGQSVITANPFLTGHDAAWIQNWSDNLIAGHRGSSAPAQIVSPEFISYKAAIDGLIAPSTNLAAATPAA